MSDREDLRIIRCKASRLSVPPRIAVHRSDSPSDPTAGGYVEFVARTTAILQALTANAGAQIGMSEQRIRIMFCALARHAAGECLSCRLERMSGHQAVLESALLTALDRYRKSTHGRSGSSLDRISVSLPVADASSGEEGGRFELLPAYERFLRDFYGRVTVVTVVRDTEACQLVT